jgi:uncharacterized protein (TIGR02611 family)
MTAPDAAEPDHASRWQRAHRHLHRNRTIAATTKIVVTLVGTLVLSAGLVMMVTPGPGLVGIAAGLAILATEWDWADRWLATARRKLAEAKNAAVAMDPAMRRKRIILGSLVAALTAGAASAYVALRDWPGWTVSLWNRAQSVLGFLPELPGM